MSDDLIRRPDAIGACAYETIECYEARKTIRNLPSADRAQGEWIPCSKRLPEYRDLVNVTTRDLRVKLAYLDSIQEDGTDDFWTMPLDDANCALWNIVAWMPLPEPYKAEQTEPNCSEKPNNCEDEPQLCRECDDYAGDGMYCASNHIVYDFSTSKGNCEPQTDK